MPEHRITGGARIRTELCLQYRMLCAVAQAPLRRGPGWDDALHGQEPIWKRVTKDKQLWALYLVATVRHRCLKGSAFSRDEADGHD